MKRTEFEGFALEIEHESSLSRHFLGRESGVNRFRMLKCNNKQSITVWCFFLQAASRWRQKRTRYRLINETNDNCRPSNPLTLNNFTLVKQRDTGAGYDADSFDSSAEGNEIFPKKIQ